MTSATNGLGETAAFAQWAASARFDDLPAPVRHEVQRALLNYLGCAMHGSRHPTSIVFRDSLSEFSGAGQATVIGVHHKANIFHAALANALHAAVDAFCDTHAEAIIHPSAPVMAAALALAELQRVQGRDLVLAMALGLEAACRISKAISVTPARGSIGWLQTGVAGGIGAAVAAGALLGLDAQRMAAAMGIAASLAGGLRVSMGTMTTPLVHAQGAETGLRAACLAKSGFTGPMDAIEAEHGFAQMFAVEPDLGHLTRGLGEHFETLALTYKAYPCGIVAHPIIDAALQLWSRPVDATAIERVEAHVHPSAAKLTGRQHPKDSNEAQFSLHHWVAVALIHGTARIADALPVRLTDPAVTALRERIEAVADASMAADAATLTATLRDGRKITIEVDHCKGSIRHPLSDADIEFKFQGLVASEHFDEAAITGIMRMCWHVSDLEDVGRLLQWH